MIYHVKASFREETACLFLEKLWAHRGSKTGWTRNHCLDVARGRYGERASFMVRDVLLSGPPAT